MWLKLLILISILSSISSQDATISCNYILRGTTYPYTCILQINNPNGSDNFEVIPGNHLDGFSDADVQKIEGFAQNTLNVPSILCRQFTNLSNIELMMSEVGVISENSFAACENLDTLALIYNNIVEIPDNTFINNNNLRYIYLGHNQITTLNEHSFTGSIPLYIDMEFNFLTVFNSPPFERVNETLTTLNIMFNGITQLSSLGFANLRNLQWMDLTANEFSELPPSDAFVGLENIQMIYLVACNLRTLNPDWFVPMRSLTQLHLPFNDLTELPDNVFDSLRRANGIYLGYNELTELTAAPFGSILTNLEVVSVLRNQIFAIADDFFTQAENLEAIELYGNICSGENHFNIYNNRDTARERLRRCFDNFGPEFISCNYMPNVNGDYSCTLDVRNPRGNDFNEIAGNHLADRENSDVMAVNAFDRNTLVIPQVLCRQFNNLRDIAIMSSYLEVLNEESLSECTLLERLDLTYNLITTIPDNIFVNNPNLRVLQITRNAVNRISQNSFTGTVIEFLDLTDNNIFEFNPSWYESINETLSVLDVKYNNIAILSSDAFANLRGLTELYLNGNFLYLVQDDSFNSLNNLNSLGLAQTGLRELNPQWFANLANLRYLYLGSNDLFELPSGVFNSLVNLLELFIYDSRLVELRADSFGQSLNSIGLIYATSNNLNAIDREIVTSSPALQYLLFSGNLCTQTNFYNVNNDVEVILNSLNTCVSNFDAERVISCDYQNLNSESIYYCEMTVNDPIGRGGFERIEGEHVGSSTDDHVTYVSILNQNTFNIPSIICTQFRNLNQLDVFTSFTFTLDSNSFNNCDNLRVLDIVGNTLRSVPPMAFSNARNLERLSLALNQITEISSSAFYNTQINDLDLSHNHISSFDSISFATIGNTLRILRLTNNLLTQLPANSFESLINLIDLELNQNRFTTLPSNIFGNLVNLQFLYMSECDIEILDENWFVNLTSLRDVQLSSNRISFLPENIFNLPNLRNVVLNDNNLRILDANIFGSSISSLVHISAENNQINSFDPNLFDQASNLFGLDLENNLCIGNNFLDIPLFRQSIRGYFSDCFATYESVEIGCTFDEFEALYACRMTFDNVPDRMRFERIDGEHLDGRNDNYVIYVGAVAQNARTIPTIICQQFRYTESISFLESNVEFITSETFRNCEFLYSVYLAGNRIVSLPDGVFSGNVYMSILNLASNRIVSLSPGIFEGTQIYFLDIEDNHIASFSPESFAPIAGNLMYFVLRHNQFNSLPRNAFAAFRNLRHLDLNGNRLDRVASNAFRSLTYLNTLEIANCGLGSLNTRWFEDLFYLSTLEVDMNGLRELPENIFNMRYLMNVGIAYNQITSLNSSSFGISLESLVTIRAEMNEINAIDEAILDNASQLFSLTLIGNQCTDADFIEIQDNIDAVRQFLRPCFDNFNEL